MNKVADDATFIISIDKKSNFKNV